jgi:hypothetical protein
MVSVAEIRNVSVLLSDMLRVHKEQISDLSNNLIVACGYIFLLGNYYETILGEKQNRLPYGSAKQNTSTTNTKTVVHNLKPGLTYASMTTHFSFVLMQNPEVCSGY